MRDKYLETPKGNRSFHKTNCEKRASPSQETGDSGRQDRGVRTQESPSLARSATTNQPRKSAERSNLNRVHSASDLGTDWNAR
jgi:hypothetical protein